MQSHLIASFGFAVAFAGLATSTASAYGDCPDPPADPHPSISDRNVCEADVWIEPGSETHDIRGWCTDDEASFQISTNIRNYEASVEVISNRHFQDQKCDWGYLVSVPFCGVDENDLSPKEMETYAQKIVVGPEGSRWYQGPMFQCPSNLPVMVRVFSRFEARWSLPQNP